MASSLRLGKKDILRGYRSFNCVLSRGESLQAGVVRCFFVKNQLGSTGTKVGFAVSRRVQTASAKNRLRRLMKEAYRVNRSVEGEECREASAGANQIVLVYTPGNVNWKRTTYAMIEQSMIALLKQLAHQ